MTYFRSIFIIELLIAELLFAVKLKRRKLFWLRLVASIAVCVGISFAIPVAVYDTLYFSMLFFVLASVTLAALWFMYDEPIKNIVFCVLAGYTVQHFASELYELFYAATGVSSGLGSEIYGSGSLIGNINPFLLVVYVGIFYIVYVAGYFGFARRMQKHNVLAVSSATILGIVVIILFVDIVFGAVLLWSMPADTNRVGVSMLHVYNIVCCSLSLWLLFEMPRRKSAESELEVIKRIAHQATEQSAVSRANMELINIKCHDLKHQLRSYGEKGQISAEAVKELENAVEIYDGTYRTGNDALDTVLKEKSLLCKSENINLSCLADGEKLMFMNDADIYALFGNLLSNAVEAVTALEPDKRTVGLFVRKVKSFTVVNAYNGYAGTLVFDGGLPVTTKASKAYHGYGLKSVRYIAEKYGGELRITADDGIFDVKILFPTGNN